MCLCSFGDLSPVIFQSGPTKGISGSTLQPISMYSNVTKKTKPHFYGVKPANSTCCQEPPFSSKLGIQGEPVQRGSKTVQMHVDKDKILKKGS